MIQAPHWLVETRMGEPIGVGSPSSKAAALGRQVLLQPFSTGPEKTLNGTAFSRS